MKSIALSVDENLLDAVRMHAVERNEFVNSLTSWRRIRIARFTSSWENLNTHKPKEDRWPKNTSWFTCTSPDVLVVAEPGGMLVQYPQSAGAYRLSFTSPEQPREAIDKFVVAYNKTATPFERTEAVVHPTGPKLKYADLCK